MNRIPCGAERTNKLRSASDINSVTSSRHRNRSSVRSTNLVPVNITRQSYTSAGLSLRFGSMNIQSLSSTKLDVLIAEMRTHRRLTSPHCAKHGMIQTLYQFIVSELKVSASSSVPVRDHSALKHHSASTMVVLLSSLPPGSVYRPSTSAQPRRHSNARLRASQQDSPRA